MTLIAAFQKDQELLEEINASPYLSGSLTNKPHTRISERVIDPELLDMIDTGVY